MPDVDNSKERMARRVLAERAEGYDRVAEYLFSRLMELEAREDVRGQREHEEERATKRAWEQVLLWRAELSTYTPRAGKTA